MSMIGSIVERYLRIASAECCDGPHWTQNAGSECPRISPAQSALSHLAIMLQVLYRHDCNEASRYISRRR